MPQSFSSLQYHLIFSTKDRAPLITSEIRDRIYGYIGGIISKNIGVLLITGGTNDHIHLLLEMKRDISMSDAVRLIKSNSSKWINEELKTPQRFAWQAGYAVFTVSKSVLPKVTSYIKNQEEHHKKLTYRDEVLLFLEEYGLPYDENYMWG